MGEVKKEAMTLTRNVKIISLVVMVLLVFSVGCSRYAKDDPLAGIKTYRDGLQMFNNYTEVYVTHMEGMTVEARAPIVAQVNPLLKDANAALSAWGSVELKGDDPQTQVLAFNAAWSRFWSALIRYGIVEVKQ